MKMKTYTIEEFLAECEDLCRNPYTYDYDKMPIGLCNGHEVRPYIRSWHSIVVDGIICDMAEINEKYPEGDRCYVVAGDRMTALEYVRYVLEN